MAGLFMFLDFRFGYCCIRLVLFFFTYVMDNVGNWFLVRVKYIYDISTCMSFSYFVDQVVVIFI